MRKITRAVAFEPDGWTDQRRAEVTKLFDSLAADWNTRDVPGREAPLVDALDRGLAAAPLASRALAVDIGAGTGIYDSIIAEAFGIFASVDMSAQMLAGASAGSALRIQADASVLPFADGSVDALILQNCFLFPAEAARVVAQDGVIIWVNSRGTGTPIHLLANEVDEALPGDWQGVSSMAGWGTWSVHWPDRA